MEEEAPGPAGEENILAGGRRPKLLSVVGTYMKPEMHTIYRQIANVKGFDHVVVAERVVNLEEFPFGQVEVIEKVSPPKRPKRPSEAKFPKRPRAYFGEGGTGREGGSNLKRFWLKHVKKKWPPAEPLRPLLPPLLRFRAMYRHYRLLREFRKRAARYRVAARKFRRKHAEFLRAAAELERRGFSLTKKPCRTNRYRTGYDLTSVVERHRPDLVHVYFGNKAAVYIHQLERLEVPWVVSFHGADIAMGMECRVYQEQFKRMFDSATLLTARSEQLLGQLVDLGCPVEKLRMNRTAIPMDEIPWYEREVPSDGKWVIVQACRLLEKKGLETAVRGFALAREVFPEARFVICGTGPMEARVRGLVEELGLGDSVELTGLLRHDELFERYRRAHVFLHPSETPEDGDQEGVPNALLEGMATGLPFVSTLHGGIPEVLSDGEGGHLVAEKSPESVGEALMKLMGDADHYGECAAVAREIVAGQFSLESSIGQLESVYREAIGRGGGL